MNRKHFTVASLFSGAGGLDLGFEWEGFNVLWASDLNKDAPIHIPETSTGPRCNATSQICPPL